VCAVFWLVSGIGGVAGSEGGRGAHGVVAALVGGAGTGSGSGARGSAAGFSASTGRCAVRTGSGRIVTPGALCGGAVSDTPPGPLLRLLAAALQVGSLLGGGGAAVVLDLAVWRQQVAADACLGAGGVDQACDGLTGPRADGDQPTVDLDAVAASHGGTQPAHALDGLAFGDQACQLSVRLPGGLRACHFGA